MKSQTLPPPSPERDPLPRTVRSLGVVSRSGFPAAALASRCHVSQRGRMWPIFRVKSSFSSVIRRQRRQKHAAQHCPWHNLFKRASMWVSALPNVQREALRQQQRASTVAPNWHFLQVAGRTRRKKHAAGHYLRDNIVTWACIFITAL